MGSLLTEIGGFRKRKARLRIALVYPNEYKVGMANLGYHTVYSLFNGYEDVLCERFFLGMKNSIESNAPLSSFDVVGFSLQYEMDYVNLIRMLEDDGIEPLRWLRKGPMVIAGGPCCFNPLPLTYFVDLFVVGDVEPVSDRLMGALLEGADPSQIASEDGLFSSELLNPTRASKAKDLDSIPAPINQPRPTTPGFIPTLGSTFLVEISRGCNVRCRFCMYSHCTLPKRERSIGRIREIVEEGLRVTRSQKISLIGALVTDHSEIKEILSYMVEKGVSVSLPSIRTDEVDSEMLELVGELGIRTLTIAPEGSPHVRSVLKKDLSEDGLRYVTDSAAQYGVNRIRLYFITGVPGEAREDLDYISELCNALTKTYRRRGAVTASVNPLVPKAHAPSEFLAMADSGQLEQNYRCIRRGLNPRVGLKLQSIRQAILQAYLALGGAEAGKVLLKASETGARFSTWRSVSESLGYPISKVHEADRPTPWSMIDTGISGSYLKRQYREMAGKHSTTKPPIGKH